MQFSSGVIANLLLSLNLLQNTPFLPVFLSFILLREIINDLIHYLLSSLQVLASQCLFVLFFPQDQSHFLSA